MRPGPGLVVMALAFISGARRGSTSQQISTSRLSFSSSSSSSTSHKDQPEYHQEQEQLRYLQRSSVSSSSSRKPSTYYFDNYHFDSLKLSKIGYDDDEDYGGGTSSGSGVGRIVQRFSESPIFDSTSSLSRVNPWLSACDLAQPNSAPDLQGQCSAGSLPVAWVDEGPGPPRCPKSCEQLKLEKKSLNINYNLQIKDNKYSINNQKYYSDKNSNNNFNTMNNIKTKVKREIINMVADNSELEAHAPTKPAQKHAKKKRQAEKHQDHSDGHQQQLQQQCLDYLGDNEESSPTQLCKKSRSDLANKLRLLRLKHCCERTVFSALHTLALNATLSGGDECVQTLTDILDMDALATRISCEYTEILFRYDCRQVYSLKHQCEDCKEAYRRWVCSTLIPYFAEPADIRQKTSEFNANMTTTSNSTNKNDSNNQKDSSASGANSINEKSNVRMSRSASKGHGRIQIPSTTSIISSKPHQLPSTQSVYASDEETESKEMKSKSNGQVNNEKAEFKLNTRHNGNGESNTSRRLPNKFISTAIEDPNVDDPVISRLKRSKRKAEFRKRRKIRPCLSVCQTVEQKCPYLLPGDRAPAYPTQYAGEPTFLCLDPNIPETGEQLRKSNNGLDNCCYRYCEGSPANGLCTYCDDFVQTTEAPTNTTVSNRTASHATATQFEAISTTSIANRGIEQIESLEVYASDGEIFYYDSIDEMPKEPIAICQPVPAGTSKCMYYGSVSSSSMLSTTTTHRYLIILSILWYLVNNCIIIRLNLNCHYLLDLFRISNWRRPLIYL